MYSRRVEKLFAKIEGLKQVFEEFVSEYPDEAVCRATVLSYVAENKVLIWNYCGTQNRPTAVQERDFPCDVCKRPVWVTAGTGFEQVELFRPWLAWFRLQERGIVLNAFQFHDLLEIPYFTAYKMSKQIHMKLCEILADPNRTAPSSAFSSIFYRRSRETPAGEHPVSEEKRARLLVEKRSESISRRKVEQETPALIQPEFELSDKERLVFSAIVDAPISFGLLLRNTKLPVSQLSSVLTMMELKGALSRLPGDNYERADLLRISANASLESAVTEKNDKTTIKSLIKFVRAKYQGISRKYLQLYAAPFLFSEGLESWKEGALLDLFVRSKKIPYREILEYVSELQVAVFPRPPDVQAKLNS